MWVTDLLLSWNEAFFILRAQVAGTLLFWLMSHRDPSGVRTPREIVVSFACALLFVSIGTGLNAFKKTSRFSLDFFHNLSFAALLSTIPISCLVGGRLATQGALSCFGLLCLVHFLEALYLSGRPRKFSLVGDGGNPTDEIKNLCARPAPFSLGSYYRRTAVKNASEVVISTLPSEQDEAHEKIVDLLARSNARVVDEVSFYGDLFGRYPVEGKVSEWTIFLNTGRRTTLLDAWQRSLDIFLSLTALILCAPFLVVIAAAIKLEGNGPVFFIHRRRGKNLRPFSMFKFRSMCEDETADPKTRVTPLGRMLRDFHLDELPQLVNILRGEMSFVGPRPECLTFAEATGKQLPLYNLRSAVRPGLTGWAQINQGHTGEDEHSTILKLSYDLFYLKRRTIFFDLSILTRTAFVMWCEPSYKKQPSPKFHFDFLPSALQETGT